MAVDRLWSTRDPNQSSRGALRAPLDFVHDMLCALAGSAVCRIDLPTTQ
jgi:hypothetical protein